MSKNQRADLNSIKCFTIWDNKAGAFHNVPFFCPSADGVRVITRIVNDPDKRDVIAQFPQDFALWLIGEWDPIRGVVIMYDDDLRSVVCTCDSLISKPQE